MAKNTNVVPLEVFFDTEDAAIARNVFYDVKLGLRPPVLLSIMK